MSAIPGELATDQGPPMTIPLRHFLVGLGFLLLAAVLGTARALDPRLAGATLAHVHLVLAGWVCVTIMGAMTQFVPVWSGVPIHSRRLAGLQLWLVSVGLLGFAGSLLAGRFGWLPLFGGAMLLGFWTFVYNVARTLAAARPWDVTERHFALALGFFVLVTLLGLGLATDFTTPVLGRLGLDHTRVLMAHVTLAIFGAVVTTLLGALYQLATMFTQTSFDRFDRAVQRVETVAYPLGVLVLAGGRLFGRPLVATVGGLAVALSLLAFSVVLARRLVASPVGPTPMLVRYAVAAPALALWALLTVPAWASRPLSMATLFGAPGTAHLLAFGAIGFVVIGTLYHVVPFIVWVGRYSDRLGYEPVPMIDDLYDARLARVDFVATLAGAAGLFLADALGLPPAVTAVSGVVATVGFACVAANLLLVVRNHSPRSVREVLLGSAAALTR